MNDAPVLDNTGNMTLTTITEDNTANAGQTVASIILSAGGDRITDVDTSAIEGIAITATTNGNGTWQYSTNAGGSWTSVGTVSSSSALLLRSTDMLRFVPDGQNATSGDITFRAWDQTSGTFGTKVDTSTNGGTTAFSTATEVASITVTAVNDNIGALSDTNASANTVAENAAIGTTVGITAQAIDVDSGNTVTYSLDLNAGGRYAIDSTTGVVTVAGALNAENQYSETIVVRATSSDGSAVTSGYVITVTSVNEAPTDIRIPISVATENFESGASGWSNNQTVAGGTTLTNYLGGFGNEIGTTQVFKDFALSGAQNSVTITFDMYELDTWDGEAFKVWINGVEYSSQNLWMDAYGNMFLGLENELAITQQMTTGATNLGGLGGFEDEIHRYSFTINTTSTNIRLGFSSALDEGSGNEQWGVDNLSIVENRPSLAIAENSTNGTTVGTVQGYDVDAGTTLTYSLTDSAGGRFAINASTGAITVANGSLLNYEAATSHSVTVQVSDGSLTFSKAFTIDLTNVNEGPTALSLTGATTGAGTSAIYNATLDSYYAVVSTTMTWEAAMDNAQASFLNGVSGTLANINSSTEQSYLVSISTGSVFIGASDKLQEGVWQWYNGDTALTQFSNGGTVVGSAYTSWQNTMPDNLGNEDYGQMYSSWSYNWNDTTGSATGMSIVEWTGAAYRAATDVAASVMENASAGTMVGTMAATDPDSGETFTYTLVGGATSKFQIVGNQLQVKAGATFDYETTPTETVTVRVTDSGGNARDLTTTINVVNVNEAPTNTGVIGSTNLISNGSFEGNTSGWTLTGAGTGELTGEGSTAGSYGLGFSVGNNANDGVATTTLNTTVGQTYTISFDMGAYGISAGINSPQSMSFQVLGASTLVNESLADSGTSPNTFNSYRYTFVADSTTTTLRFADTSSVTNSVDVVIDNVRAFAVTTTSPTMSIAENSANGTVVGQVASTDPDAYKTMVYTLTNNAGGAFAINSATGQVTVASSSLLNFETTPTSTIVVRTTDQGGLTFDKTVTINLTNVNEGPVAVADSATAVEAGGTANGTAGTNPTGNVLTNDTDVDASDTKTVAGVAMGVVGSASTNVGSAVTGTYGSINIAADGSYTYTVDNNNATVQALRTSANTLTDVFTYTMRDAAGLTSTTQITMTIQGANDAPIQSAIEVSPLNYTEGAGSVAITSTLTLTDFDDANLTSAVIQITGNYVSGQDLLAFTDQNGIASSWDGLTGTLTLTGSASKAQYEAALRSVTYSNNSELPSSNARTISFTVSDGALQSATTSRDISIASINDAPLNWIPGTLVTGVNTTLTMAGANAVQISDVDAAGGNVRVTLNASSGMLTLSGTTGLTFTTGDGTNDSSMVITGTIANINAALDGMQFTPTNGFSGSASVTLQTEDLGNTGAGGNLSDTDVMAIQVGGYRFQEGANGYTGTQDTYVSSSATTTAYGNSSSVLVDDPSQHGLIRFDNLFGSGGGQIAYGSTITNASLSVYVTGTDNLDAVTVHRMFSAWTEASTWNSLTNGVQANNVEASASISYTIDAGVGGWVTITGLTSTVQAWSDGATNNGWALLGDGADNWTFHSSEFATVSLRPYLTVAFSAPQSADIDLDANNSSGTTGSGHTRTWTENGGALTIADSDATISDIDSSNLQSMTVSISNLQDGTAELLAANTSGTSITASYNSSTGVLTLSGTDTVANYQQVLRTVTYNNTSESPSTTARFITIQAADAYVLSNVATATINVISVNDAPVLDATGSMTLTAITEDELTNVGNSIASIISSAGGDRITDVDAGAVEGIAITALNSGNGVWQYSLNGGTNWSNVGSVGNASALLLRSTDLLRFVPNGTNSTTGDITFRAWDQTAGTVGTKVDTSINGGSSAFSSSTEVASITVNAVNDTPNAIGDSARQWKPVALTTPLPAQIRQAMYWPTIPM